ncbi:MAG: glycosyltransferase family 4 protein [Hyphomicrobiaceae bacterium]
MTINRPTVVTVSQVFCEVLPPVQSSLGIWTWEVGKRLTGTWRPIVLARGGGGKPRHVQRDGLEVEHVGALRYGIWRRCASVWQQAFPQGPALVGQPFYAFDYVWSVARRLRELKPDVVHVQNFASHVPFFRRAAPDAAIVLHMHCDWLVEFGWKQMARAIADADVVIGCSRHVADAARARFGHVGPPFEVVPNGASIIGDPGSRADEDALGVLFVGRVSPEKGLHVLLEAWPAVVTAFPGAHLDIVGSPVVTERNMLLDLSRDPDVRDLARFYPGGAEGSSSYLEALRRRVPAELAHTVRFIGGEPYAAVQARYRRAAVLVNPSLSESFGMSVIEAMAAGAPVVATSVGGMTEVLGRTGGGLLIEKNDPRELAMAIKRLLADRSLRRELGGHGARRVADTYAWDVVAARTEEIYRLALELRARRVCGMAA